MWEIEDGDSNEVCLAKTMLQIDALTDDDIRIDSMLASDLFEAGAVYASEVLNSRAD
jgi:hypothetical protein